MYKRQVFFTSEGEGTSGFWELNTRKETLTIEQIKSYGESIYFEIYSHAHLAENSFGITENRAEAYVSINSIKVVVSCLPICEGDFDEDGDVDGSDLSVFAADFGRTDCATGDGCEGDFDKDDDVDGSDLAVFAADFGRTDCP